MYPFIILTCVVCIADWLFSVPDAVHVRGAGTDARISPLGGMLHHGVRLHTDTGKSPRGRVKTDT